MSTPCIFCKIIRKEAPAEILMETERVVALLDIRPIQYGHALIIPRTHWPDLLAVPEEDLHEVMRVTQLVARGLVEGLGLEGFNVFANNGRIAGQSVFHFHMHVTPRYPRDNIRFVLSLKEYPEGLMQETARKIRTAIGS
jgi:histidine triad (HIT) family protein